MPGGLLNIISIGDSDLYLTASPQITYFKTTYRRHTNFARETIQIPINNINFDTSSEIIIPHIGDLVYKIFIEIDLPEILILKNELDDEMPFDVKTAKYRELANNLENEKKQLNFIKDFFEINVNAYNMVLNDINAINVLEYNTIIETIELLYSKQKANIENYNIIINKYKLNYYSNIFNKINYLNFSIKKNYNNQDITEIKKFLKKELTESINECKTVYKFFLDRLKTVQEEYDKFNSEYIAFEWKNKLIYKIINNIEVYIGNELIDNHIGEWLEIYDDLFQIDQNGLENKYKLIIPLQFWFCKSTALAFPLISLQHNDLKIKIKLNPINKCTDIPNIDIIWNNKKLKLNGNLMVDYIFLDNDERKIFSQSSHEYLIETVEMNETSNINTEIIKEEINFKGPIKELIWTVQNNDQQYIPIISAKLDYNNYPRIKMNNGELFNILLPYKHHNTTPNNNIYIIPFSLHPNEHQPSGTANLGLINSVLTIVIDEKYKNITLKTFALKYNILRFIGGYAALAFI